MLVISGDQATILAHLQTGGVRGAEPFAGVTLVPVDQAALAQQVLSRPLAALATVMSMEAFKNPPNPTMESDPLKATPERPAMVLCGGVVEHPYRVGPPLLWDLESPIASSLPAARPSSVKG